MARPMNTRRDLAIATLAGVVILLLMAVGR